MNLTTRYFNVQVYGILIELIGQLINEIGLTEKFNENYPRFSMNNGLDRS